MTAKTIFITALCLLLGEARAQDAGLYWKYKDYDGVAFTLPRVAIDIASAFLDEREDRVWLRHINKVRVMVFEDSRNPVTGRDLRRFQRKAARRHLEDLLMVRDGKTHIHVMAKERRSVLRKVVVLTQSPEEFVLVTLKGKLRWDDIIHALKKYKKQSREGENPLLPAVIRA